ncbi:hypothetical protein [Cytobacillus kochii]|uniref:hypothetical protein n=1 Tax=Cytobacillus kochii TaxID=859143 RepID=UPI00203A844D|nr:hypothetical protein [Cytobacillus kochii]MCM3324776.1 hypothetical protein [Cytobacillus kochii]MCM3347169.1 hypothetical protein [Cytobacillus kochii]
MNKIIQWIIWSLIIIVVNLSAVLIAMFSLFGTQEGTSIFSLDYAIAIGIILVANFITIQLFFAIRNSHQKGFILGLIVAVLQAFSLYLLINTFLNLSIILIAVSIIAALVLLVIEIKNR